MYNSKKMLEKHYIHQQFMISLQEQIKLLQLKLADLKHSASNETKSTAGDKHETALAMLQIEQEMARNQLQILQQNEVKLLNINPLIQHHIIALGSLIKTNKGHFYMSIALTSILINNEKIIAISPSSPLGQLLIGLKKNETTTFNKVVYIIEKVE